MEPSSKRMMNVVLMAARCGTAPPKRKQKKAKRSNQNKNLGNIKLYFTQMCLDKDLDSNTGKEGGPGGQKRKMVEETDLSVDRLTKKSCNATMVSTLQSGCTNSRTIDPVNLGEIPIMGGSQARDGRRGLELTEKEGGIRGAKTRRLSKHINTQDFL